MSAYRGEMPFTHEEIAARLRAAYGVGAVPPLRDGLRPDDAVGAYAVQSINTQFWLWSGRQMSGRKIGLTSKAVQAQLGVDQPDFGTLFTDMRIEDGGVLAAETVLQPKAEAEVAIVLARSLSNPEATEADVAAACDYVCTAIEIVDSRIADWKITFADTVADNGSAAFYALGQDRRKLEGLDLFTCGMAMMVNDTIMSTGAGAACLGHPLKAAAWLARTFARAGEALQPGDIILTGALGPMAPIHPGDRVEARIGGLGTVNFTIESKRA